MKTLYESILDDEDSLINNVDKLANWHETVIEYVKKGKYETCAEWLDDNIKLFKNGHWIGLDTIECLIWQFGEYYGEITHPVVYIDYSTQGKSLVICFLDADETINYKIYLELFKISLKEYNKVKNNIIKNFKVKKHPSIKGQYERKIN